MTENRYIYESIGIGFEILDSWFGYTGDGEPTEREIEEYDYLVIGLASNQDAAEGICRRLNDQQDEINHLSNFGLHVILDKKNKEIEELKQQLSDDFNQSNCITVQKSIISDLKKENLDLSEELDYYKTKCASLENGLLQSQRDVEWLRDNTVWEQMPIHMTCWNP